MTPDRWWMTEYRVGRRDRYGDFLWARTEREAKRLARRRGIGEWIHGPAWRQRPEPRASTVLRWRRARGRDRLHGRKVHAVTWVANLALGAGVATRRDLLGDLGIVHLAAHVAQFGRYRDWVRLSWHVADLEARIPGYLTPTELREHARRRRR